MIPGHTILLIEDHEGDAALFAAAARRVCPKATLLTLRTADEAMLYFDGSGKYADRKLFPVAAMAFIDLGLPGMPGEKLIKWIRAQTQFQKLLIAVYTYGSDVHRLAELYRWGADSFLLKTHDLKELSSSLSELTAYWLQRGLFATAACDPPSGGKN
jgi:DNA-binding response OmpR family regulator